MLVEELDRMVPWLSTQASQLLGRLTLACGGGKKERGSKRREAEYSKH